MQGISMLLIMIVLLAIVEYYTFNAIKFSIRNLHPTTRQWIMISYIIISVLWLIVAISFPAIRTAQISKVLRHVLVSFFMGIFITKMIISLVLLIDDLRRVFFWISSLFFAKSQTPAIVQSGMTRSQFFNSMAMLLGGGVLTAMLAGMRNRHNYQVNKIPLKFHNLPIAFDGIKIVQISDIHSGSFTSNEGVKKGIDLIMKQQPDMILFTGDLVNSISDEMLPYIQLFSELKAPLGVYSILGNHDYGDYHQWSSIEEKNNNLQKLHDIHAQMGWQLLLNENKIIEKNNEQIALIGVENISFKKRFKTYGNMDRAYKGVESIPFKILMSHDPSHWDGEINKVFKDINLTLSGHTHGFQFGVEIPWLKWSPVQYIYKQWAGLYKQDKQYLYVNRGFGFIGYPGRVGILPEITVLELSRI